MTKRCDLQIILKACWAKANKLMIRRTCSANETHIKFLVSLGQRSLEIEKDVGRYR
jgi:hypothetical protein